MKSNKRVNHDDYLVKLSVYETMLETLNDSVLCAIGEYTYDIPEDEVKELEWSERFEHIVEDEEGLRVSKPQYDNPETEWQKEVNNKYYKAVEAYKVCRAALDKWLDK